DVLGDPGAGPGQAVPASVDHRHPSAHSGHAGATSRRPGRRLPGRREPEFSRDLAAPPRGQAPRAALTAARGLNTVGDGYQYNRSNGSREAAGGRGVFASVSKQLRRRDRGFTLIELVVVLAILGILIALAVPRYLGARKKAYKAEGDNILQEAKTLEWAYYQQYNTFYSAG